MDQTPPVQLELFHTPGCPACKALGQMLDELLPGYGDRFRLKRTLASGPMGYVRTLRLGIHAVPALLIGGKVVFRQLPSRQELIETLNSVQP
ncbi:MAG TPA: thioredoxin family protein [Bacteroidales bacterium]|nr:thioredoxin family protein [Bacteroidales bacterium]